MKYVKSRIAILNHVKLSSEFNMSGNDVMMLGNDEGA